MYIYIYRNNVVAVLNLAVPSICNRIQASGWRPWNGAFAPGFGPMKARHRQQKRKERHRFFLWPKWSRLYKQNMFHSPKDFQSTEISDCNLHTFVWRGKSKFQSNANPSGSLRAFAEEAQMNDMNIMNSIQWQTDKRSESDKLTKWLTD